MPDPNGGERRDEAFWRDFLTRGDTREAIGRRVLKRLPHGPRCRLCAAPFAGPAAPVMRLIGKRPSSANPNLCTSCFTFMSRNHGGAEIEASMLFADIRGSTALGERLTSAQFHDLLNRYQAAASRAVFDNDGVVDKFVGDEMVALFFPLISGERHAERAVSAALDILRATGHAEPGGPWVPVGAGVHTGKAWFGTMGEGTHVELTAVGDTVNTAARFAAAAGAGEVVVSRQAARDAGVDAKDGSTAEVRTLAFKGKKEPMETVILRVDAG